MLAPTLETLIRGYNCRNGNPLSPDRVSSLAEELATELTAAASSIDWQSLAPVNQPITGDSAATEPKPESAGKRKSKP